MRVIGSAVALPAVPIGMTLMAVGIELGNVYGRTVLLNAMSDMSNAVTQTLTLAQEELKKPRTARGTRSHSGAMIPSTRARSRARADWSRG